MLVDQAHNCSGLFSTQLDVPTGCSSLASKGWGVKWDGGLPKRLLAAGFCATVTSSVYLLGRCSNKVRHHTYQHTPQGGR